MIFELSNTSIAEHLFAGIDDSMVRSCLQGMMGGKIYVTDPVAPKAAMAFLAEFAFFAGEPDRELASFKPEGVVGLVPPDERWPELIGECWPDVPPVTRYAIRKDTVFNREKLEAIVAFLPEGYELKRIDGELYEACLENEQFEDNVGNFASKEEFLELGRGFAILKDGEIVSIASSYTVYREGIEVEIDTEEEYRRQGLASVAGAALILSCLDDGLYSLCSKLRCETDAQCLCEVLLLTVSSIQLHHLILTSVIISSNLNFHLSLISHTLRYPHFGNRSSIGTSSTRVVI